MSDGKATKRCSRCSEMKPRAEFNRNKSHRDGSGSYCRRCRNEYGRWWSKTNQEKVRLKNLKWRKSHPEQNRECNHAAWIKSEYGITRDGYSEMLLRQGGVCAICKKAETVEWEGVTKRLSVDHSHETGKVRALLCNNCNRVIGLVETANADIYAYLSYLNKHTDDKVGFMSITSSA